jgi:succinate dehydrogenase / fumarate reductase iron-sulfur subunit
VRINGKSALACNTKLGEALERAEKYGFDRIVVEPMGNMPVIKDLIVDMDAVHWKKIQRVTPWLLAKEPVPEREYVVSRESMVDVTQPMACIQCGACVSDCLTMEVDPLFIGPAALAKAYRFVGDPRDAEQYARLKDLAEDPHGMYDCTHCFKCIDACPNGAARAPITTSRTATTGRATSTRSSRTSSATGCCTRPTCCPTPTAASSTRAPSRS